jgi:hypothetical protein
VVRADCKPEVVKEKGNPMISAYERWLWRGLEMVYGALFLLVAVWTVQKLFSVAGWALFVAVRLLMAPLEAAAMTTALTDGEGLAWKLCAATGWATIGIVLAGQISLATDACSKRATGDFGRPVSYFGYDKRGKQVKGDRPKSYATRATK